MNNTELERLEADYRALQQQVCELGFIAVGSVLERYTVCGSGGLPLSRRAAGQARAVFPVHP